MIPKICGCKNEIVKWKNEAKSLHQRYFRRVGLRNEGLSFKRFCYWKHYVYVYWKQYVFFSWFWKWKTDKQNKNLRIDTISYFTTVYSNIWVVTLRATCRTFQPRHKKPKKSTPKKFLKFPEMDLSSSHIKKILIVSVWHNRTFLCFRKGVFKILAWRNFLLFLGMEFFLIFQKM